MNSLLQRTQITRKLLGNPTRHVLGSYMILTWFHVHQVSVYRNLLAVIAVRFIYSNQATGQFIVLGVLYYSGIKSKPKQNIYMDGI